MNFTPSLICFQTEKEVNGSINDKRQESYWTCTVMSGGRIPRSTVTLRLPQLRNSDILCKFRGIGVNLGVLYTTSGVHISENKYCFFVVNFSFLS